MDNFHIQTGNTEWENTTTTPNGTDIVDRNMLETYSTLSKEAITSNNNDKVNETNITSSSNVEVSEKSPQINETSSSMQSSIIEPGSKNTIGFSLLTAQNINETQSDKINKNKPWRVLIRRIVSNVGSSYEDIY